MSAVHAIDTEKFVIAGRALQQDFPVSDFSRLRDLLASLDGVLQVKLSGWLERDKAWLHLEVSGELALTCQRCLNPLIWPVKIDLQYELLNEELTDAEVSLELDFEQIRHDKALSVMGLVEDEILLALPFAPRHEVCEPPLKLVEDSARHPFSVLATIKN